jgi:hypothetical protein
MVVIGIVIGAIVRTRAIIVIIVIVAPAATVIVAVVVIAIIVINKIVIAIPDGDTAAHIFTGADAMLFLFHDLARGAVIDDLDLRSPVDRFDFDLGRAALDLDPVEAFAGQIVDDRLGGHFGECGSADQGGGRCEDSQFALHVWSPFGWRPRWPRCETSWTRRTRRRYPPNGVEAGFNPLEDADKLRVMT